MFDACVTCGTTDRSTFKFWRITAKNDALVYCRACYGGRNAALPDVYYGYGSGTHTEENIAYPNGHPQAGQPIPFSSKSGKKAAMDLAGVREVGDAKGGARNQFNTKGTKYFT